MDGHVDGREQDMQDLRQKLHDLQALYDNLLSEERTGHDARLVSLLQSKCLQLERQVRRLKCANDLRQDMVSEVENFALQIAEMVADDSSDVAEEGRYIEAEFLRKFTSSMAAKVRSFNAISDEAKRQHFFVPHGTVYLSDSDTQHGGYRLQDMFPSDISPGDLPALNVRSVSSLSKRLEQLYSQLIGMHAALDRIVAPVLDQYDRAILERVSGDIGRLLRSIEDCSTDMVELGAVVPDGDTSSRQRQPPVDLRFDSWDTGKNDGIGSFSVGTQEILERLPPFSTRDRRDGERLIRSLVQCFHTQRNIWKLEKQALLDQINFLQNMKARKRPQPTVQEVQVVHPSQSKLSKSDRKCLLETLRHWNEFEADTSERTLHNLLQGFSRTVSIISRIVDEEGVLGGEDSVFGQSQEDRGEPVPSLEELEDSHQHEQEAYKRERQKLEYKLHSEDMYMEAEPVVAPLESSFETREEYSVDASTSSVRRSTAVRPQRSRRTSTSRKRVEQQQSALSSRRPARSRAARRSDVQQDDRVDFPSALQQEYDQLSRSSVDPLRQPYTDSLPPTYDLASDPPGEASSIFSGRPQREYVAAHSHHQRPPPQQRSISSSTPLSQHSNIAALDQEIERQREIVHALREQYENEFNLSEPLRFALKKKVQVENAKLIRLERTRRQCEG